MKKLIIIFSVLALLVFIRPVLGLNANTDTTDNSSVTTTQVDQVDTESNLDGALNGIAKFYDYTGFANATLGHIIMIIIGIIFIYLGIKFDYEPLLLIPIGMGVIIGNIPFVAGNQTGIYETGSVLNYLYFGVVKGIYPPLIFLGIGAMTDFSSLIANPKLMLLGGAAQIGVFATFLGSLYLGFNLPEAGAIGIIGGADGPTAIFLSSKLANGINVLADGTTVKNLIGPIAIAAYSYMALVPVIQPPLMRLFISKKERKIKMKPPRAVTQKEKMIFPVVALILTLFISPSALPLLGMLFFGNLLKESGRTERLAETARTKLIDIVTILLGVTVGASTQADIFITKDSMLIFGLGAISFVIATSGGLLFAKFMNLFLKGDNKINPLIGAAGVSAVPDSARVVHSEGLKSDKTNYLLMHAMAPNVSGVIGSAIAAGIILSFLG
ncbi:sodium ion-translocating decarboxylase subunit beta [Winogradskyella vidalii]|uniref:sodium ion-translocating decarboxylase subunit beta n=1 Tax=Winogradskyella vidalii TaxID=2615024 RepID=UPI0015C961C0|nr:sodium ion-translocating decarboxylase subunit beta [Winogradskyella vidalii]